MARALLLNASFEPLCVVSSRRAVVLVLKEKAEIVHRNGAVFRSERRSVPVPTVIRLVHFVRVPFRASAPLSRRAVFARDNHRCQYCGRAGREPRPRRAAVAAGHALLGQRGRVVPVVQRAQGRPAAGRVRHGAASPAGRAARDAVADRVGRSGRPRVAAVPLEPRSRLRVTPGRLRLRLLLPVEIVLVEVVIVVVDERRDPAQQPFELGAQLLGSRRAARRMSSASRPASPCIAGAGAGAMRSRRRRCLATFRSSRSTRATSSAGVSLGYRWGSAAAGIEEVVGGEAALLAEPFLAQALLPTERLLPDRLGVAVGPLEQAVRLGLGARQEVGRVDRDRLAGPARRRRPPPSSPRRRAGPRAARPERLPLRRAAAAVSSRATSVSSRAATVSSRAACSSCCSRSSSAWSRVRSSPAAACWATRPSKKLPRVDEFLLRRRELLAEHLRFAARFRALRRPPGLGELGLDRLRVGVERFECAARRVEVALERGGSRGPASSISTSFRSSSTAP